MLSHVVTSVSDSDRAHAFYSAVLSSLGIEQRFHDPSKPWAGWHTADGQRPLFVICRPFDGAPHDAGNGQMVAFLARSRAMVREAHALALAHGGRSEGGPGLRPHYQRPISARTSAIRTATRSVSPAMSRSNSQAGRGALRVPFGRVPQ